MDRPETEKSILRTEADGRTFSLTDRLWSWRYGARGPGLAGFAESGLPALGPDDLRAWVGRYFTKANAVVWFSGMDAPDTLRLALATGQRRPTPVTPEALPATPAYFPALPQKIGYQLPVPRTTTANVSSQVLQRELFRRMRHEEGYSYTIAGEYLPLDADNAEIIALADVAEDRQEAALGEFVDVLATLQWGDLDPADLVDIKAKARADLSNPSAEGLRLPGAARDLLLGRPVLQDDELLAELEAVTAPDVQSVIRAAAGRALLLTPRNLTADWAGFTRAPAWSDAVVHGQPYVAYGDPKRTLVIGPEGMSVVSDGDVTSVAFSDCQAMLVWPDGGRVLVGGDGISCALEPTLYPVDPRAVALVDQRVPPGVVVRMTARAAGEIPAPPVAAPAPAAAPVRATPQRTSRPGLSIAGIVVLGVLMLVLLPVGIVAGTEINGPEDNGGVVSVAVICGILVILAGSGIWALGRGLRRR
jgi:hypothetical protein